MVPRVGLAEQHQGRERGLGRNSGHARWDPCVVCETPQVMGYSELDLHKEAVKLTGFLGGRGGWRVRRESYDGNAQSRLVQISHQRNLSPAC